MPPWMRALLESGAIFAGPMLEPEGKGGGGGGEDEPKGEEKPEGDVEHKDEPKGKDKPDDKPKVSDAEARLLKDMMRQKAKAKEEAEARKKAEKELEDTKSRLAELLGDDGLEGLAAKLKAIEDEDEGKAKAKGDFDALQARLVKEHAKELARLRAEYEPKVTEASEKLSRKERQIRQLMVTAQFASSKYRGAETILSATLAEQVFGSAFEVVEGEDGELSVVAKRGKEPLVDSEGNPLGFDEALKELVEAHADAGSLKKAKAKPGSGGGGRGESERVEQQPKRELRGPARIAAALAAAGK